MLLFTAKFWSFDSVLLFNGIRGRGIDFLFFRISRAIVIPFSTASHNRVFILFLPESILFEIAFNEKIFLNDLFFQSIVLLGRFY